MLFGLAGRPEVRVGDYAPDFELEDQHGKLLRLSDLLKHNTVVLFFYPKDNTSGCEAEACSFRDAAALFSQAEAVILGISSDSKASHNDFAQKHQLPFSLLADARGKVRKLYGVPLTLGLLPGRVTYVISQQGIVTDRIVSQFDPAYHIEKSLKAVQTMAHALSQTVEKRMKFPQG